MKTPVNVSTAQLGHSRSKHSLFQIMRVVHDWKLEVDSLNATPYAIRIILSHELTVEEFKEYSLEMANGIWDQES